MYRQTTVKPLLIYKAVFNFASAMIRQSDARVMVDNTFVLGQMLKSGKLVMAKWKPLVNREIK